MSDAAPRRVLRHTTRASRIAAYVGVWAVLAFVAGTTILLHSSRTVVLASHDAVLRPTLDGKVELHTGPVLPDFRTSSGHRVGVDIILGKTEASSTDELVQRYAYLASQPEGQVAKVREALLDLVYEAALRGAVVGLVPVLVWLLLGRERRRQLLVGARGRGGVLAALVLVPGTLAIWQPWDHGDPTVATEGTWVPLGTFLGPEVPIPVEAEDVEVRTDVTTLSTRRLVESAVDTYGKSKEFYKTAAEKAEGLDLHQPRPGDTVVVLVSDRHDNIGMDAVARTIGEQAGATAVFDAGDDTSTGKRWEAFSLDSLNAAFDGYDSFGVAGNHDSGSFVHGYLEDRGWTMLDGKVVDGPGGTTLLGVDDPRSSGLGNWRDETGLSFEDVGSRLSDVACAADERVTTMLVHDTDLAREALARGCVDLVLGGHTHVQYGPNRVVGSNGEVGYTYTTGTAGGAAYAIAIGSKLRRAAGISLVTYRDGRPAGIQPVVLQTDGRFQVGAYLPLALAEPDAKP